MTYTLKRDYIPLSRITYQAFGLDKNKTVFWLSYFLAGVEGLEPSQTVLETGVLPLTPYPYFLFIIKNTLILVDQQFHS